MLEARPVRISAQSAPIRT